MTPTDGAMVWEGGTGHCYQVSSIVFCHPLASSPLDLLSLCCHVNCFGTVPLSYVRHTNAPSYPSTALEHHQWWHVSTKSPSLTTSTSVLSPKESSSLLLVRCELGHARSLPSLPDNPWEDTNNVLDIVHPSHFGKLIKSNQWKLTNFSRKSVLSISIAVFKKFNLHQ
jgi:hypothetical protein